MGVRLSNQSLAGKPSYICSLLGFRSVTSGAVTIGRVYLSLYEVTFPVTLSGVSFYNFATVAGNITVGLYKVVAQDVAENSVLIAESASTALAGVNSSQTVNFASPVSISPGQYYVALEFSNDTHTIGQSGLSGICYPAECQNYFRGGGYGALTNPCPATTATNTFIGAVIKTV